MLPSLDNAPCGFVSVADDGTMVAVNHTLAELLGSTRAELEGWHIEKLLPPGARIFYQTQLFPLLRLQGRVDEIYISLRTRNGESVPMLMNAARTEREGSFVTDCVFMRMIQRHAFEDQLVQARRLAEQANAVKASFLAMMSHDLRTPLVSISGYADLLLGNVLDGQLHDEQRSGVERIRESAGVLLTLINDILAFAKIEAGHIAITPSAVDVAAAVARAERLLQLRIEEAGLTLSIESGDAEATVIADSDRLQQILLNLFTNAIKFTPAGGRIVVSWGLRGDRVHLVVSDSGPGIPAADRERIFEPFVQLESKQSHAGVGLGLAISRDLARAMGGELSVKESNGEGATFVLDLPCAFPGK